MNALTTHNAATRAFKADQLASLSKGVALSGIAGPDGCILCGNTIEVRGYDCWACECAYNTDVRDTTALAAAIGRALELQMDAERGQ